MQLLENNNLSVKTYKIFQVAANYRYVDFASYSKANQRICIQQTLINSIKSKLLWLATNQQGLPEVTGYC